VGIGDGEVFGNEEARAEGVPITEDAEGGVNHWKFLWRPIDHVADGELDFF
jgi:hypothetical protein